MPRSRSQSALNAVVAILLTLQSCKAPPGPSHIRREQAIDVAIAEARRLGYETSEFNVDCDDGNSHWQQYTEALSKDVQHSFPELALQLDGRGYWAIYFKPHKFAAGGDLWLFVKRTDGRILGTIRGR